MRYMGWVGKFEKYYGVLRRGGGGVNKIFGYYVVFEWSLLDMIAFRIFNSLWWTKITVSY